MAVTKPRIALLHQCSGCNGKGYIQWGKHQVPCTGCNNYGFKLEILSKEKMLDHLRQID